MVNLTNQNYFIVIEGLDGSGKTLIGTYLLARLRGLLGERVQFTYEPNDPSAGGLFIRQVLAKQIRDVSPVTLALAFAFNRMDHNQRVIDRFLNGGDGRVLVCDRYYLSSLVYQATPPLTIDDVMNYSRFARRPDLTLFLDVDPATSYQRMDKRLQDRELFETNLGEQREKYHAAIDYLRARGDLIVPIDANPDFDTVAQSVLSALIDHAPQWLKDQADALMTVKPPPKKTDAIATPTQPEPQITSLTDAELIDYFVELLRSWGYQVGDVRRDGDFDTIPLTYALPAGLAQRGVVLVLTTEQRTDTITRYLQAIMHGDAEPARLADFVLVLDTRPVSEVVDYYERDAASKTRQLSPTVKIFTRVSLTQQIHSKP